MTKVLVIGLDGGTWNIIKPLVRDGKLPTIARLMKNGCYGDLESSIPFVTFPAWKCYSTGKNPGKLGVYWFISPNMEKEKFEVHSSISFKSRELWNYFGENDIVSVVLDMPTTYPPKKIKGAMVSNGAPMRSNYTYPRELREILESNFNYKIDPDYYFDIDKDLTISDNKRIIQQRFDVAKYLVLPLLNRVN
jgi:predicted AlkP superfamily phosphohydrolase/phosphomutase